MINKSRLLRIIGLFLALLIIHLPISAQSDLGSTDSMAGTFSLGVRSTINLFDHDGTGLGTGGQFRIRLSERINTDWFADYITINTSNGIQSTYYHIGWSLLYYPLESNLDDALVQPYVVAGHCFDYNEKVLLEDPTVSDSRWGSAVQAGLGTHLNITERFDISLTSQYMIHLTRGLELTEAEWGHHHEEQSEHRTFEGHLLTSLSMNYKIGRLWGRS